MSFFKCTFTVYENEKYMFILLFMYFVCTFETNNTSQVCLKIYSFASNDWSFKAEFYLELPPGSCFFFK